MDPPLPSAHDHCQVLILVRQYGYRSTTIFNRILERLQRVQSLQISDNPRRQIIAKFASVINPELKFGELQAHRRILGLIAVIQSPAYEASSSLVLNSSTGSSLTLPPLEEEIKVTSNDHQRRSSLATPITISQIEEQYEHAKEEFANTLVDSRCFIFGYPEEETKDLSSNVRGVFTYESLEECGDSFENRVRDLIRSIFYVLESRRLDLSLEKLEHPPCPCLPDEQKYQPGTENKSSKMRQKCIGRLRKQIADYTLLTGSPATAVDAYQHSIDLLKSANDFLWLAAAYEGWACSVMIVRYGLSEEYSASCCIPRVSSMNPQMLESMETNVENMSSLSGHRRNRSVGDRTSFSVPSLGSHYADDLQRRPFKLRWSPLSTDRGSGNFIGYAEIIDKFKLALENYERFSFAVSVEYECMMKAASVYRYQRRYIDLEHFIREHIVKYLDDGFTLFDHHTKANICQNCAKIYRQIGFRRKYSFFARLAVLFRLHIKDGEMRTSTDYRQVYPILYRTLSGYGIPDNPKDVALNGNLLGPVHVQRRALHEVFMSALRAEYFDAAIRHLCFLLQVYYDEMDAATSQRMLGELANLIDSHPGLHSLSQHLSLPQCGLIIPPLQMTRFPRLEKFVVCALPPHLAPRVIRPKNQPDIFIYCPFQSDNSSNKAICWVVDCACEVSVSISNSLPFELSVSNLSLLSEGCVLEPAPVRLNLAPYTEGSEPVEIKLIGFPRSSGKLTITGYSCEVLGVRNVCRLRDLPTMSKSDKSNSSEFDVEVLPALPVLGLETSLPRAPISKDDFEPAAEAAIYSGQTFEHTISIVNKSDTIAIRDVRLEVLQPKVCGGPLLIELLDEWRTKDALSHLSSKTDHLTENSESESSTSRRLKPGERKQIRFRIFGIDPSAMTDDGTLSGGQDQNADDTGSFLDRSAEGTHDRIPFTGRLLTSEFVFHYIADIDGKGNEQYERRCRLPLAVTILPAVTVSAWHVLPGDSPATRYVVVDVTNATDWDAELTYGMGRVIGVQPKEICRVPLLCKCCSEVPSNAFQIAASRASHMMQMQEMERLRQILERHVSAHLDIHWSMPSQRLYGSVPVGPLLSSVTLLKQLVVPAMSIEVGVNGIPYVSEDEIPVGIGEIVDLNVRLISSMDGPGSFSGVLQLRCYQDMLNGSEFIDRRNAMVILNHRSLPFTVFHESVERKRADTISVGGDYMPASSEHNNDSFHGETFVRGSFSMKFSVLFRFEGVMKVKPVILKNDGTPAFSDDELFCSAVTMNVVTKTA